MATHDWNNDGKNDMIDNYIEYRRIDRRSRLDVLYLLHAIKFENIWSDEI